MFNAELTNTRDILLTAVHPHDDTGSGPAPGIVSSICMHFVLTSKTLVFKELRIIILSLWFDTELLCDLVSI